MKKLLYVVAKSEYFLSHRLDLAKSAQQNGFNVAVASTPFKNPLNQISNYVIPFKRGGINLFQELKNLWQLFKVFRSFKPNLVHNVALKPVLYGAFLCRILGIPSINSLNGFGYIFTSNHLKARLLKPFILLLLKLILNHNKATVIIQNSDDYKDCSKILSKTHLQLIPGSGVDTKHFKPNPNKITSPIIFVLVARMLWSKGVGEYVSAATQIKKTYPDTRFLLVGNPDPENPESIPSTTLQNWHNSKIIEWLGYQDDIKNIYANSHIAVLPSYREGMPKSLLEAMASGLPIITTNTRGCRDLFHNNGYLVPVKNVHILTKAMENIIKDISNLTNFSTLSRESAENIYNIKIINAQFLNIYKSSCI